MEQSLSWMTTKHCGHINTRKNHDNIRYKNHPAILVTPGLIPKSHRAIRRGRQQAALRAAQHVQHRAVPAPGARHGRGFTMDFPWGNARFHGENAGEMRIFMTKILVLPSKMHVVMAKMLILPSKMHGFMVNMLVKCR